MKRIYGWQISTWKDVLSLAIRDMKRCHYISIRMTFFLNDHTKCLIRCQKTGSFIYCWWECIWLFYKTVWQVSLKAKLATVDPYDPAIALLDIYPREMKISVHIKSCYMIVHSSFICNSPKLEIIHMSFNRQVDKLFLYIQAMENYPAIKRNRISIHTTTWINLQIIILTEKPNNSKRLHSGWFYLHTVIEKT